MKTIITTADGSFSRTEKRYLAWKEWWLKWPSTIARKELQEAFFAGWKAASEAQVERLKELAANYDNVSLPNTGAAISKQAIMYAIRELESL